MIKRGTSYLIESLKILDEQKIIKKAEMISGRIIKLVEEKEKEKVSPLGWKENKS